MSAINAESGLEMFPSATLDRELRPYGSGRHWYRLLQRWSSQVVILRHDLRNGMGAVSGFAELIQMESSESCEALPRVVRLRQCVKAFLELLDA